MEIINLAAPASTGSGYMNTVWMSIVDVFSRLFIRQRQWAVSLAKLPSGISSTLLSAALLTGCAKDYPPPEVHRKADPGQQYSIRLELESPSIHRLTSITGFAEYDVANFKTCVPRRTGIGPYQPFERIPIEVKQVAEKTFTTSIYRKPLVDEDYYGLGKCEWTLGGVNITMNGIHGKVVASLAGARFRTGQFDIICNEQMRLCSFKETTRDIPKHIRTSKGVTLISGN